MTSRPTAMQAGLDGRASTHTFMLHLADCPGGGGETVRRGGGPHRIETLGMCCFVVGRGRVSLLTAPVWCGP
jgi:hypothetical protein